MSTEHLDQTIDDRRRWRRLPYGRAILVYLLVHLATLLGVAVVDLFTHHGLIDNLSIWDGTWFLRAVHHGWPSHLPMAHGQVLASPVAFFPLLPIVLRTIAVLTGLNAAVVGLVVSGVTGLSALVAIATLAREFAGEVKAERAALLIALSPGSFVFNLIYAEGFLLTFVALGLWALLRRRWLLAGLLGALATAASPVGVAFVVSCVVTSVLAIGRDREWRSLWAPLLAPLGFIAWMAYLWIHTGNAMAWRLTERGGWNSYPSLLYPFRILAKFIANPLSPTMTGQILFAGTVITIVMLVVAFRERQPVPVLTYATTAVVLFAISYPVGLRPRFVMLAFPLTIAAATRWSGWRYRAVVAASAVFLVLMTVETLNSFAVFP